MSNHSADSKYFYISEYPTALLETKKKIWAREREEFEEWFPFGSKIYRTTNASTTEAVSSSVACQNEDFLLSSGYDQRRQYLSNPCLSIRTEENQHSRGIHCDCHHCCCCCLHCPMCCNGSISCGPPTPNKFNDKRDNEENQEILKRAPNLVFTPAVSPIRQVPSPSDQDYLPDSTDKDAMKHKYPFDSTPANFSSDPVQNLNTSQNSSNRFHRRSLITNYRNSFEKLTLLDAMQKIQLDLNEQLAEKEKFKSVAKQSAFLEIVRLNEEASRIEEQEKNKMLEEEDKKDRDKEKKEKLTSFLHSQLQEAEMRAEREKSARLREHSLKGNISLPRGSFRQNQQNVVTSIDFPLNSRSTVMAPKFQPFDSSDDDTTSNSNRSLINTEMIIQSILKNKTVKRH